MLQLELELVLEVEGGRRRVGGGTPPQAEELRTAPEEERCTDRPEEPGDPACRPEGRTETEKLQVNLAVPGRRPAEKQNKTSVASPYLGS